MAFQQNQFRCPPGCSKNLKDLKGAGDRSGGRRCEMRRAELRGDAERDAGWACRRGAAERNGGNGEGKRRGLTGGARRRLRGGQRRWGGGGDSETLWVVHGAARSSSGPERRRAARGSGAGAPNKRVGPALLESGAGKARKRGVSGGRGGSSGATRN